MKKHYLFLGLLLVALVSVLVISTSPRGAVADDGTVMFSHEKHKDLAECGTCHATAATSTRADDQLLPKPEVCASCHEAKDVRGYWSLKDDAALDAPVFPVKKSELFFSHQFHLEKGGATCATCHAGIAADKDDEEMPSMETCYGCHNDGQKLAPIEAHAASATKPMIAGRACEMCHTTLAGMTPKNHQTALWTRMHGRYATSGEAERECAACHSQSFCQECHTATNAVPSGVAKDKFYIDTWPRGEKMDDGKLLTVQSAHNLTYRYTHGFDARAQSTHCERCHEAESFCTPCHENGYDGNGARIVPQSHQLAGFSSVTGGKAMNRHAKLAERDLMSCATCHNVDGGDPVCAKCHSTGVVKGGD